MEIPKEYLKGCWGHQNTSMVYNHRDGVLGIWGMYEPHLTKQYQILSLQNEARGGGGKNNLGLKYTR